MSRKQRMSGKDKFLNLMTEELPKDVAVSSRNIVRNVEVETSPKPVDELEELRQESEEFNRRHNTNTNTDRRYEEGNETKKKTGFLGGLFGRSSSVLEDEISSYGDVETEAENYISEEEENKIYSSLKGVVNVEDVIETAEAENLNIENIIYLGIITKNDYQSYLRALKSREIEAERKRQRELEEQKRREELQRKKEEEERRRQEEEERIRKEQEKARKEEEEKLENIQRMIRASSKKEDSKSTTNNNNKEDTEVVENEYKETTKPVRARTEGELNIYDFLSKDGETNNKSSEDKTTPKSVTVPESVPKPKEVIKKTGIFLIGDLHKVLKNSGVGAKTIRGYEITDEDIENHLTTSLKKYDLQIVNKESDLDKYLYNKSNVLILTKDVEKKIQSRLGKLLRSIAEDEGLKYRVVTIKGEDTEVKFKVVEDSIVLTGESLDEYYENNPVEDYYEEKEGFSSLDSLLD